MDPDPHGSVPVFIFRGEKLKNKYRYRKNARKLVFILILLLDLKLILDQFFFLRWSFFLEVFLFLAGSGSALNKQLDPSLH